MITSEFHRCHFQNDYSHFIFIDYSHFIIIGRIYTPKGLSIIQVVFTILWPFALYCISICAKKRYQQPYMYMETSQPTDHSTHFTILVMTDRPQWCNTWPKNKNMTV